MAARIGSGRASTLYVVHLARAYQPWLARVVALQELERAIVDDELEAATLNDDPAQRDELERELLRVRRQLNALECERTERDELGALRARGAA